MEIDNATLYTVIVSLTGAVCFMFKLLFSTLSKQVADTNKDLREQKETLSDYKKIIDTLNDEIDRLKDGCGIISCRWNVKNTND